MLCVVLFMRLCFRLCCTSSGRRHARTHTHIHTHTHTHTHTHAETKGDTCACAHGHVYCIAFSSHFTTQYLSLPLYYTISLITTLLHNISHQTLLHTISFSPCHIPLFRSLLCCGSLITIVFRCTFMSPLLDPNFVLLLE